MGDLALFVVHFHKSVRNSSTVNPAVRIRLRKINCIFEKYRCTVISGNPLGQACRTPKIYLPADAHLRFNYEVLRHLYVQGRTQRGTGQAYRYDRLF